MSALVAFALLTTMSVAHAEDIRAGVLNGTLTRPANVVRPPVVLLIAGSGPTDRDGQGPLRHGPAPLKRLSEALVAAGFATLRYDKRGARGWRPELGSPADFRFHHYVEDAAAFVDVAAADPTLGPVAVVGHSEGAMVGAVLSQRRRLGALVVLTGGGRPMAETLIEQLVARRAQAPELTDQVIDIVRRIMAGDTVDPVPAPALNLGLAPTMQRGIQSLFAADPVAETRATTVPILIVGGARDIQVGREHFDRLVSARPDGRAIWLPTMNHMLVDVGDDPADQIAAYRDPDRPLSPALVEALVTFLREVMQ